MILGIDHLALSCPDLAEGVRHLESSGYHTKFMRGNVHNHPLKSPVLRRYDPQHAIAYMESDGWPVELTLHSLPLKPVPSPYQILLGRSVMPSEPFPDPLPSSWAEGWQGALGGRAPQPVVWTPFSAQAWCDDRRGGPLIHGVLLPVRDLSTSERLWCGWLGCAPVTEGITRDGSRWRLLQFETRFKKGTFHVLLVAGHAPREHGTLDDAGFTCIGLIVHRLVDELAAAVRGGAVVATGEFSLSLGDRYLNIALLRGPDGELLELIEVHTSRENP
jgi:catechol 2,3-dioxygenase-like lactoylglutathione lyase family enzyme